MYFGPLKVIILDPPLHLGVIENDDNTSSFFVDCNNAEAHFIHSVVDNVTVNDILDPVYVPHIVNFLFPLNVALFESLFAPMKTMNSVFHFTKEKIAKLKAKANAEISTTTISSLQALLAHLLRSVVCCQSINYTNQEVRYKLFIGAGPRLKPSLPEGYFGNAIHGEVVCTKVGELLEQGLGWAALKINDVIALQTNDVVRDFFNCWVKNPKLLTMSSLANATLYTSSSPQFNVYGNDLGWGKPLAVRSGLANKRDGKITIFPGMKEGSVDIEVCLLPEKFLAMENDKEFMQSIGI
ncbi:hypothetical protein HYC85_029648 [Camellia sinensis]|uniref:Uncharacterized protein n=1 Tax=Camellia sinensis TaxID=4442 RepID=A0A7J7FZ73_CAMSI|nr:hypothetical protein HYC85_029648 [Camellia sinensis]